MAAPAVLVLIPESTRKDRGGDPGLRPADAVAKALPADARTALEALREDVRRGSPEGSVGETGLLPAYRRFQGNMYREIPAEAWEQRRPDVEVLIASGLFGLVASRDSVPWYEHSMAEPLGSLGKLNRWWRDHGLPAVLRAYVEAVRPGLVVDLLSLEYRESVAGFADGLKGIPVKTIDFPGAGRGSQPLRGARVAEILRTAQA